MPCDTKIGVTSIKNEKSSRIFALITAVPSSSTLLEILSEVSYLTFHIKCKQIAVTTVRDLLIPLTFTDMNDILQTLITITEIFISIDFINESYKAKLQYDFYGITPPTCCIYSYINRTCKDQNVV